MKVRIGSSKAAEIKAAVAEASASDIKPGLILFFAPVAKFSESAAEMQKTFPTATIIGTTSHYLYASDGLSTDALGMVSFEDGIVFSTGIIEEIKRYPMKYASVVKAAHDAVPHDNTVCFEFTTALSMSEELVLATLNSICEEYDIPVFGGSAGLSAEEFFASKTSYVSLNGKVYTDASVFFFIHNVKGRIALFKENIYQPASSTYTVTSVDVKKRIVRELDGEPICKVLCRVLNCMPDELPHYLKIYPFGRKSNDDLLLSDFNTIFEDGSISWNTRIYNGTKICIVGPGDYRTITQQTFDLIHAQISKPSFTLLCHCLARTVFYEEEKYLNEYAKKCGEPLSPLIGFSSTGEQLRDMHLNQAMIAAVFE